MFGLKIRSWMENHIVRPRKKGNKNKNGNSSGNFVTSINNTQNGHKGISSNQGDSSVVGSPARRSEVSPIQNHTTSRFGWHSPEDEEFCKIDQNLPYMVKTSTYSPKVRPMNSKTINRSSSSSGNSHDKIALNAHTNTTIAQQQQQHPYSKSVDAKYFARTFNDYSNSKLSPRDNSAVLRAVSASTSANNTFATATSSSSSSSSSRLNKYSYQRSTYRQSHEMFEQQTQPQQESKQNTFGKYEKNFNGSCSSSGGGSSATANNGIQANSHTTAAANACADDGENNQMVVITINGSHAQQKQKTMEMNKHATTKLSSTDKPSNHQQSSMIPNYHNNHLDYRNGSQMSFYDNQPPPPPQQQQQQQQSYDDELHRQHYFLPSDRQKSDTMHSGSDGSSTTKSEQQIPNIYHQQNGFLITAKKQLANNNECDANDHVLLQRKPAKTNQYGKILNYNRNGSRPIPMLPSPPSTPPPPLNAKIKDHHESSNKFYQEYQSTGHLNNQQQNRFNGNGNVHNNNNNNEMSTANNNNNNNNNANGFEFYSNGCSHASITSSNALNKQSTKLHGNGIDENALQQHKELVQSGAKCKQTPSGRTNNVYHHSNGIGATTTHLTPTPSNHQLAHVINSLSSPESAYSTGYSTDGTSPSGTANNAPEYYINMRTGTHYFPRGVNAVAAVERSRQKFGLNKIEETVGETICTTTITTSVTSNNNVHSNHRRTESCDLSHRRHIANVLSNSNGISNCNGVIAPCIVSKEVSSILQANTHSRLSPDLQRHLVYQSYRGFESPSPRQRCRIKTNPWLSTPETTLANGNSVMRKMDIDTSSTSSGIKSSSDAGTDDKKSKNHISSESESSSTEIEVSRKSAFSPNTIRKRKLDKQLSERLSNRASNCCDSDDEDATFNELMGKFDESYIYEKETDILSDDSDQTECASDLDTGQDAGDECDTDELLDIDYIDTGSIQEVTDKDMYKNTGSCTYFHNNQAIDKRQSKLRKSRKQQSEESNGSRRRKRLTRTRKRNSECRDSSQNSHKYTSPHRFRESRSVGGTPVSLRRNKSTDNQYQSTPKMVPLSSRCNSLTFSEIHSIRSRFLAIAESEKALLKADIEADVKYKQLIHEAETILVSMKTTALRETPVPSPSRRVCNVPANKRVEMLRNCEADLRRELLKTQSKPTNEEIVINRKDSFETLAAPSSPVKINYANGNGGRFSPRKTHLTNFINQNITSVDLLGRRQNGNDTQTNPPPSSIDGYETKMKRSPCLQFNTVNNRVKITPPKSPMPRRRFRSQSPRICIESDSDSDTLNGNAPNTVVVQKRPTCPISKRGDINRNKENKLRHSWRKSRQPTATDDILNQNTIPTHDVETLETADHRPFRSIDMAHRLIESFYCPQSEPLKRKIYSEKTLDRLQKSLDMESEIPRKALLQKISNLRRDRQQQQHQQSLRAAHSFEYTSGHHHSHTTLNGNGSGGGGGGGSSANASSESDLTMQHKRQLILNTIEDLKRNLEDQSIELCGLNDDEE